MWNRRERTHGEERWATEWRTPRLRTIAIVFVLFGAGCSDDPVVVDGGGDGGAIEVVPAFYGIGNGSVALRQAIQVIGYDPDEQRTTRASLGTREFAFATLVRDSVVLAVADEPRLIVAADRALARTVVVDVPETDVGFDWIADAGEGRLLLTASGRLIHVDGGSGAVLDSVRIDAFEVAATLDDEIWLAASPDGALVLTTHRITDLQAEARFETDESCPGVRAMFEMPPGQLNIVCAGTGNEPGGLVAVDRATGDVLGRADHDAQLGSALGLRVPIAVAIPALDEAVIVSRETELVRYDPHSIRIVGALDLSHYEGRAAISIAYHAASQRLVLATQPEPFRVEGPFAFEMLEVDGSPIGSFGSNTFSPTWVLVR